MIELRTDYEARALARLTELYRKPHVTSILGSWSDEIQQLEVAFWDLLTKRGVATGEGNTLDLIGKVVGQPREGRTDEVYRLWIAARILVNKSSGLPLQLQGIVEKLVGDAAVRLEEQYPASVVIHIDDPIAALDGVEIAKLVVQAKAGGVRLHLIWRRTDETFRYSPTGVSIDDSSRGFGRGELSAVSDGREMGFAPSTDGEGGGGGEIVVIL